jgi:ATP-dependent DNA helicase PIF1
MVKEIMAMTEDQRCALQAVQDGRTIFLTGPAGTGKTHVLKEIIKWARRNKKKIGVTAMTGSAALLLGGRTLHSYLGLGLGDGEPRALVDRARKKYAFALSRARSVDLLVIDEISMADDAFLDNVSEFLKIVRYDQGPFGGVQIVFCGDLCQLPPVHGKYCFGAKAWAAVSPLVVHLTKIFRQDSDAEFRDMLQRLRGGQCNDRDYARLKDLCRTTNETPEHVRPTRLYSRHRDVDAVNLRELQKLPGSRHRYPTRYSGDAAKAWANACGIPETMDVCPDCQVVLTCNLDQDGGLVNGSRGRVVSVQEDSVSVEWVDGSHGDIAYRSIHPEDDESLTVDYLPLKLAWAITIHKSQGMTLDAVEIDLGDSIFEYGQAYTALSRARTLDSIRLTGISKKAFRTHPDVLEFYKMT